MKLLNFFMSIIFVLFFGVTAVFSQEGNETLVDSSGGKIFRVHGLTKAEKNELQKYNIQSIISKEVKDGVFYSESEKTELTANLNPIRKSVLRTTLYQPKVSLGTDDFEPKRERYILPGTLYGFILFYGAIAVFLWLFAVTLISNKFGGSGKRFLDAEMRKAWIIYIVIIVIFFMLF